MPTLLRRILEFLRKVIDLALGTEVVPVTPVPPGIGPVPTPIPPDNTGRAIGMNLGVGASDNPAVEIPQSPGSLFFVFVKGTKVGRIAVGVSVMGTLLAVKGGDIVYEALGQNYPYIFQWPTQKYPAGTYPVMIHTGYYPPADSHAAPVWLDTMGPYTVKVI